MPTPSLRLLIVLAACCSAVARANVQPEQVIYPSDAPRFAEHIETLRAALDATVSSYGPYIMQASAEKNMSESRYFDAAQKGIMVNVVWGASSIAREAALIPIRIPLTKGLLGYRIFLVPKDRQEQIARARTRADLAQFEFGLGFGWGEIPIYRQAGFKVQQATYDNLFKMLNAGRFELFSRGVNEVFGEYSSYHQRYPNLAIEQHLLLHTPFPYYFFVSKRDPALAQRISTGLRIMLKNGRFNAIFLKYNASALNMARMGQRHVIEINNPELPPETPLNETGLWYVPGADTP